MLIYYLEFLIFQHYAMISAAIKVQGNCFRPDKNGMSEKQVQNSEKKRKFKLRIYHDRLTREKKSHSYRHNITIFRQIN